MKKVFVLMFIFVSFSISSAFAYDYSNDFYDKFFEEMFTTTADSLLQNGITADKVDNYIKALKTRVDRRTFENNTWSCVRENELVDAFVETGEVDDKCFEEWKHEFMTKNADLLTILQ